ncbi:MAG TPA: hypothetical protein VNT20_18315 [Flavisolibacter sp.]|jgi:hypothetical protein|nr:hypothetical protein [Flavisolibacter sp.]
MSNLKKHIYKKFYHEVPVSNEVLEKLENLKEAGKVQHAKWEKMKTGEAKIKIQKNQKAVLLMDSNKAVDAFPFNYKGQVRYIPEPDPILIYFHTAYVNLVQIESKRDKVFANTSVEGMTEQVINDLYEYYGLACSLIILLFTSLEAFINRSVPDAFEYKKVFEKRTEIYNKQQIQWLSFDEKVKTVLPKIKEMDFGKSHPILQTIISNLKDFRNSIVHTREEKEGHTPFDYLFKRAFTFDYRKALNAVKDFCNFYHGADYIQECPCSQDW